MKTKERILVTPDHAKEILKSNKRNRAVKNRRVFHYSRQMKEGLWFSDIGDTIKIDWNLNLLDGQHRLLAVIHSNTSQYFDFHYGINPDAMRVIDTGSARSASDVFAIEGTKYSSAIPAMISKFNYIEDGKTKQLHNKKTSQEIYLQYEQSKSNWEHIAMNADRWYKSFGKTITPSLIGGLYAYFSQYNEKKATSFFEQLCVGINIENQTILLLRNTLIRDIGSVRKMTLTHKTAIIIKSFISYLKNKNLKVLKYDINNEPFPSI